MEVLILQAFVSLMLVGGSLLLFGFSWRQRDHEHADRLALLPAEDDDAIPARENRADDTVTHEDSSPTAGDSNGIRG
jgi:hypothetical protein